jgi:hypothetical protein
MGVELAPALDREMPTFGDHRLNTVIRQILPPLREIFCCANDVRLTSPISSAPLIRGYGCMLDGLPAASLPVDLQIVGATHRAAGHDERCRLDRAADLHGASPECLAMCFLETVVSHYFACTHLCQEYRLESSSLGSPGGLVFNFPATTSN